MSCSSVFGHIEGEFLFLSVRDERLFKKKEEEKKTLKKFLLRMLQLTKFLITSYSIYFTIPRDHLLGLFLRLCLSFLISNVFEFVMPSIPYYHLAMCQEVQDSAF